MRKLFPVLLSLLLLTGCGKEEASIGIIGGADGPTAIFVSQGGGMNLVVIAVLAVAIGLIVGILRNRKHK